MLDFILAFLLFITGWVYGYSIGLRKKQTINFQDYRKRID